MTRAIRARMRTATARVALPGRFRAPTRAPLFALRDKVRALIDVNNEGLYPHRDIGERLVERGDAGVVRETGVCFGEPYYAVEFVARAVVVAMTARDIERTTRA